MVILKELVSADIFKKQLLELDKLPNAHQNESIISNINDISQVLKLGVAQLSLIFEEQGVLDFSEVGMQAIKALDSREVVNDIVLFLEYQIKHLLIELGRILIFKFSSTETLIFLFSYFFTTSSIMLLRFTVSVYSFF